MASSDPYRYYLHEEGEKNTKWIEGAPPNFDVVNKLFEEGRTQVWSPGSLEEKVQNLVKTFEMEIFHKVDPKDVKSFDPNKITLSLNGRKAMTMGDVKGIGGGYNFFLQTALPEKIRVYDPSNETSKSSLKAFTTTFPRGFAVEVLEVYSGPPKLVYKFRHWGYMEGPFKGHAPTGELVEFFGMAIFEVEEDMKIFKVEFFFDRGELLGGLVKGLKLDTSQNEEDSASLTCPLFKI